LAKPFCVEKEGNVAVPIYRGTCEKNGRTYESFTVHFYTSDHKRKREAFANQAKKKAREVSEPVERIAAAKIDFTVRGVRD